MDLALIERWLTGWSLSRGVPLPLPYDGGLVVEVGMPAQLRRYVFADAGQALQACADRIRDPHIFLKAPVEPEVLRQALPARWKIEVPGYFMQGPSQAMDQVAMPDGYRTIFETQHGAKVVRVIHESGELAHRAASCCTARPPFSTRSKQQNRIDAAAWEVSSCRRWMPSRSKPM